MIRKLAVSAVASALALVAAGCSSGGGSGSTTSSDAAASTAPASSTVSSDASTAPGSGSRRPAAVPGAAWQSASCSTFDVNASVAAIADCGYITVPEKHADAGGKSIKLAVVRLRSSSAQPGAPVFVGGGGPGLPDLQDVSNAALASGHDVTKENAAVLADHDYVYFSQRGTQYAQPFLGCAAYDEIPYQAGVHGWTRAQQDVEVEKAFQSCKDKVVAEGVDLDAYNSNENADDVDDVRRALGYDQIIFYGESYGTLLGQFVMRRHPEILQAAVFDGVVPASATSYAGLVGVPAAFQRVFAACAADTACKTAYPDVATALQQVVAGLDANPLPVPVTSPDGTKETVKTNATALFQVLLQDLAAGGKDLPNDIEQIKFGDPSGVQKAVPSASPGTEAGLMAAAVDCSDDPSPSIDTFKISSLPAAFRNVVYDDAIAHVEACKVLDVPRLAADSDVPVQSDVPVLILNGGLDAVTPAANGHVVEKTLPNSQYVLFPGGGHVQAGTPCSTSIVAAFLAHPAAKVDTSCIPPKPVFGTPTSATAARADGSASITLTLPIGWTSPQPGIWTAGGIVMQMQVFPAGVSPAAVLKGALSKIAQVQDSQITIGPPIAGLASKMVSLSATVQGEPAGVDAFAVTNSGGSYLVTFTAPTDIVAQARPHYPGLLYAAVVKPA